ncbi:MAG: hypothetical protein AB7O62_04905 [Pirellulales bacterium]
MPLRLFLAGIMQGSHLALTLHNQDYRGEIKALLARHLPRVEVYDPLAGHADSVNYDDARGREVFLGHNRMCRDVDILLAVVPQASMGTAIEMWEAHQAGRVVVAISPLSHNWAVKYLSHILYTDLSEFAAALANGSFARALNGFLGNKFIGDGCD